MPSDKAFSPERVIRAIAGLPLGNVNIMEVCGTHTMAIAKAGIKSLLPGNVKLLSGPGCPVCVTPAEVIDTVLELAMEKNVVIGTYGDMVRVPGSRPGDSLQRRRALGAEVKIVYSPVDAVDYAAEHPEKQVVFLGVGFETTAPGTGAAVLTAKERGLKNFSVYSMLKTVEPALRALVSMEGFDVQGFLCPGHVATITGAKGFEFLPRELKIPAVISGFGPEDILLSVYLLLRQISEGKPRMQNEYERAVQEDGNILARKMIGRCFMRRTDIWRGLGVIEQSGLGFRDELSEFDAEKRFGLKIAEPGPAACCCGDVICGRMSPAECPLFGRRCTPEDPVGPCMVSSEGACAAAYKYQAV